MKSELDVKDAIQTILSDKTKYPTSLNWAVNYCEAALDMVGGELRVQCLYILNNITSWRHPKAKEVRSVLKGFRI
jgi:hypothetical protein